jgi:hypothetical protein
VSAVSAPDALLAATGTALTVDHYAYRIDHPSWLTRRRVRLLLEDPSSGEEHPDLVLQTAIVLAERGHSARWLAGTFDLLLALTAELVGGTRRRRARRRRVGM